MFSLTRLAWLSAGGSEGESEPMSAQCAVPGMTSAISVRLRSLRTLSACHGSIDPIVIIFIEYIIEYIIMVYLI